MIQSAAGLDDRRSFVLSFTKKEMNENVVRNSIFSLASDGQVFTADFSCRYPIDVTVIDSISPDLSSRVETSVSFKSLLNMTV